MINIPVSVGEVVDKISILQIKMSKIKDPSKLETVSKELRLLVDISQEWLVRYDLDDLLAQLKHVNGELWDVEDKLRIMERDKRFDEEFVALARAVYHLNDKRFSLKNEVNQMVNSTIKEVKDYVNYNDQG
jgi:predicted nuclease with TOPRIM domain